MALNLSRGKTIKYYSSNRIASLVANGIMTFIDEKTKYADFFNTDEMGFYTNAEDLLNQMNSLYGNIDKVNKISKNGKRKYFSIFNNDEINIIHTGIVEIIKTPLITCV